MIRTRPYWLIFILLGIGLFSFRYYPHSGLAGFYETAASVIAALWIAIALSVFATKDFPGDQIKIEHWALMVASSAGLLAALRGLSLDPAHAAWQVELLTALTVVGMTSAVLLVAERLIAWRVAGTRAAVVWAMLFIGVAIALTIFP